MWLTDREKLKIEQENLNYSARSSHIRAFFSLSFFWTKDNCINRTSQSLTFPQKSCIWCVSDHTVKAIRSVWLQLNSSNRESLYLPALVCFESQLRCLQRVTVGNCNVEMLWQLHPTYFSFALFILCLLFMQTEPDGK